MTVQVDEELIEIAAALVPLAADGCTIDLFEKGGTLCVAASHVDVAVERRLHDLAARGGLIAQTRASIVSGGETLGEVVAWGPRTLSPLAEALVCSAAGHAGALIDARRAQRQAREAEAGRASIVAMVGHEVRAPLQALTVGIELVEMRVSGSADEVPRAWLLDRCEHLSRSVRRLGGVAKRLLDISRLEGHPLPLHTAKDELGAVVAEVVARVREDAAWAGCPIVIEQDADLEGRWDRVQLEIVVENLLTNALKYGASKPIEVALRGHEHDVAIEVRDHGCGIAADEVAFVFDRFYRGSGKGHHPGIGVGLWIVKKLVEAHGGEVSCASTPGEGATFVVTLPRDVSRGDRVRGRSGSPREAPPR